MTSSEKSKKSNTIDLETDLSLSKEDFTAMRKKPFKKERDLKGYIDFLEAIGAFKSKKIKTKFYNAEFEL